VPSSLADLLGLLELQEQGSDRFRAGQPGNNQPRVFGGQVVAQSLAAAERTAPTDTVVHSLHAHFLREGDPKAPIDLEVERVRDGRSFATRRVTAVQHDRAIFTAVVGFHVAEPGYAHQAPMPEVVPPEASQDYTSGEWRVAGIPARGLVADWPMLEMRLADRAVAPGHDGETGPSQVRAWLRLRERLPDDPGLHRRLLAYFSDFSLLSAGVLPHDGAGPPRFTALASLDHAVWFHRPVRMDEWVLFVQDSSTASAARGLVRGQLYAADGALGATAMQEILMRPADQV
jgi:acyl-CoA thioesterase-2